MLAVVFYILLVIILFSCDVNTSEVNASYNGSYFDREHRRVNVYICTTRGEFGDTLSWYHTRGPNNTAMSSVTHTNTASNEMKLTLNLALNEELNNTQVSCVKTPRGSKSWIWSESILVTFQGSSEPQTQNGPFITVTPDTSAVSFDDNEILEFVCKGSKPTAGRKLTWYLQRPGAKPIHPEGQTYDNKSYINNLVLRLNESYNGSRLYCAEAYVLYKLGVQGTLYNENFAPKLRSNNITLVQRRKEDNEDREDKSENENTQENTRHLTEKGLEGSSSPLVYVIPIGVVALLFVSAAAVWRCRRRRAPENPQDDECIYATPQVLYATLDLQTPTTEYASSLAQENSPYAKIIGIYRPK